MRAAPGSDASAFPIFAAPQPPALHPWTHTQLCNPILHLSPPIFQRTEELVEEAPKTFQQVVADGRTFITSTATGKGLAAAAGLFLGATLLMAVVRTWQKYSSPRAQRMRVVSEGGGQGSVCSLGGTAVNSG